MMSSHAVLVCPTNFSSWRTTIRRATMSAMTASVMTRAISTAVVTKVTVWSPRPCWSNQSRKRFCIAPEFYFDAVATIRGVVAQIRREVERDPDETGGMKSRVHPKYKTKYRVRNWASYERALIGRGNVTIWLSRAAIAAWKPEGTRTRGAPPKYSDLAIETALTLRLLFHLPLRQAEGFLTSLFHLMGLDLRSPDHTTLSRRGQHLNLTLRRVPRRAALHLFIDSTGLSMVGEGEWAAAKHGRRGQRGWKKLHLGVDQAGVIVAQALTDSAVDDASTGIGLIETVASSARTVTADAAYDTLAFYETANAGDSRVSRSVRCSSTASGTWRSCALPRA